MKISKSTIKILVSAVMLVLVLYSVDLKQLIANFQQASFLPVALFIIGYGLSQVISAVRWWIVARGAGIDCLLPRAISASFVGMYINVFGLGTLGGDLARALLLTNNATERQTSFATVVADRSFGLATLGLIGVVSSLFVFSDKLSVGLKGVSIALIIVVSLGWFIVPTLLNKFLGNSRWGGFIERFLRGFPRKARVLIPMAVAAITFHFTQIALFKLLAFGIGVHIPFSYLLVTIPFANILSTLPLSWMGLGVRENVYVFFFVPLFLTAEQAVLCGALWLLAMTVTSAVGGIVAVASNSLAAVKKNAVATQSQM
jgi:uncharacterized membrane protein YbhN (UPF0104 family)